MYELENLVLILQLYLEFYAFKGKPFYIHFDYGLRNREPTTRFTLSNVYETYKVSGGNTLQIPFPKDAPAKWTVLVLDVVRHLESQGLFPSNTFSSFAGMHFLKSI